MSTSNVLNIHTVAAKAEASEALMAALTVAIDAEKANKLRIIPLMFSLMDVFTIEELMQLPVFRSEGGTNADKYVKMVRSAKTGKMVEDKGSKFADLFDDLPQGKAIARKRAGIALAMDKKADTPSEFKNADGTFFTPLELESLDGDAKDERTSGIKALGHAVKLSQWIERIQSFDNKIAFRLLQSADGSVTSTVPIMVYSKADPSDCYTWSVTTFLSCDLDWVQVNGGDLTALVQSKGRSAEDGDDEAAAAKKLTFDNFDTSITLALNFLELVIGDTAKTGALFKKLAKSEQDHTVRTVFDLRNKLEEITERPDMQTRFAAIYAAEKAAAQVVADAAKKGEV